MITAGKCKYIHFYMYLYTFERPQVEGYRTKRRHSYLEVWGQILLVCNRIFWNWYVMRVSWKWETFDVQQRRNSTEVGWTRVFAYFVKDNLNISNDRHSLKRIWYWSHNQVFFCNIEMFGKRLVVRFSKVVWVMICVELCYVALKMFQQLELMWHYGIGLNKDRKSGQCWILLSPK